MPCLPAATSPRGAAVARACQRAVRCTALLALACLHGPLAFAQDVVILSFERLPHLALSAPVAADGVAKPIGPDEGSRTVSFEAFGRRFDILLEPNDRLTDQLPQQQRDALRASGTVLYSGMLQGLRDSWVRLTWQLGSLTGAIWDGSELYAIEPSAVAERYGVTPVDGDDGSSIIYRVSDTLGLPSTDLVLAPSRDGAARGSDDVVALAPSLLPARQVSVALLGDTELRLHENSLSSIANTVDGLFSQQVGVHLTLSFVDVYDAEPDPFTSAEPAELLRELAEHKATTAGLRALGLVHLVTGKNLVEPAGSTAQIIGLANFGTVCDERHGVGLSQVRGYDTATALIIAHEIGHNLGAPHDAEVGSSCAAAPATFLMNPVLNNSRSFSECSIAQMQSRLAMVGCLAPIPPSDVAVRPMNAPGGPMEFRLGDTVSGIFLIENVGAGDAAAIAASATSTGGLPLTRISVGSDPFCDTTPFTCWLPRLSAGRSARVDVSAQATELGPGWIELQSSAVSDTNPTNDVYRLAINVVPAVRLRFYLVSPARSILRPGDESSSVLDVFNDGPSTATNVVAWVFLNPWLELVGFSPPGGGTCAADPARANVHRCALPDLPPNQAHRMSVHVRARANATLVAGDLMSLSTSIMVTAAENAASIGNAHGSLGQMQLTPTAARLAVDMQLPSPLTGEPAALTLHARNQGPDDAENVAVIFDNVGAIVTDSVTPPSGGSCAVESVRSIRCTLPLLRSGESLPIAITGTAQAPRTYQLRAEVSARTYDLGQRLHIVPMIVQAVPAPPPVADPPSTQPATSGGGGGAADALWLLVLLAAARSRTAGARSVS